MRMIEEFPSYLNIRMLNSIHLYQVSKVLEELQKM